MNISVTPDLYQRLQARAEYEQRTIRAVIARALEAYIARGEQVQQQLEAAIPPVILGPGAHNGHGKEYRREVWP